MPYDQFQLGLSPPWLQRPVGENWATALGIAKDAIAEGAILAVKCRWLATCPEDALPLIGSERSLVRLPAETAGAYRARMANAWTAWQYAGTKTGLLTQIGLLGLPVSILENADFPSPPANWYNFWVYITLPNPFIAPVNFGAVPLFGAGLILGVKPYDLFAALARTIQVWRPAHAQLVALTIQLSGRLFGVNSWAFGDGTAFGGTNLITVV